MRGEKQWQAWAGDQTTYADGQTTTANTRLPYVSTLAQKSAPASANLLQFEADFGDDEEDPTKGGPEKIELSKDIPLNYHLVGLSDDDPSKMEGFMMEDTVPHNFRLVHIETEDGELMRME